LRRRWLRLDRDARWRLPFIALATVAMGVAIYFAQKFLASSWDISGSAPARIGSLVALVALGLTTYGIILHLTKTLRVSELLASLRRI
jgi:peptidoglycan biosynthesis protein MviN/MurJ (putative lipid II flippase)